VVATDEDLMSVRFARAQTGAAGRATGRDDRGATMVEFAMVFPILALLMLGIIDFGLNYSNKVQLNNATRSAARAASVANVGTDRDCSLRGDAAFSDATRAMLCSAKNRTHIDTDAVAVKVLYMGAHGKETTNLTDATNPYSIVVCMSVKVYSASGLLAPILKGHFQHSRQVIKTATPQGGSFIPPAAETPLSSGGVNDNWDWCKADDPNGTE
jgi:Flp pilus assembly protein TadG